MTGSHRTNPRDDPAPDAATDQAAARLGHALHPRFVVDRPLGRGGMGTVFLARDLRHARPVAIKVLHPELATAVGAERFLREIRTAAGLQHPNIVTVFDSGERAGLLYYIMPYVEGESLRARLEREGPLPVPEAVRIARDVAEALAFAHAHGIVHRDVKPENILLPSHGHACVVDFGVAHAVSAAASRLTATGLILGSPAYMSPEQAAGTRELDGRSDVYGLGCVLHEMLTGAPPFDGPTLQAVLLRQMTEEALDVRALRPEVPAELAAAVRRAMAKEAGERFGGAREFGEALAGGGTSLGVGADHSAVARAEHRWRPSRGVRALALGVAAASALGAAAIGLRGGIHGRRVAPTLDPARYVVLPFRYDPGVPEGLSEQDRLHDALMRWSGVDVVDPRSAASGLSEGDGQLDAPSIARHVGAGRFIVGRVSDQGDSLRIYAEVGQTAHPEVARVKIRLALPADQSEASRPFDALADSVVLHGERSECREGSAGTLVLVAVRWCSAAFRAIDRGDLDRADTLFGHALDGDPRYARAALWRAQIRGWFAEAPPDRHDLLTIADGGRSQLSGRERQLLAAIVRFDSGDFDGACGAYGALTAADSLDVDAWMGLGDCRSADPAILRDSRSPSGWRFRASYWQAVQAYRAALELRPAILRSFRAGAFARVRAALFTETSQLVSGSALAPDTGSFLAAPGWEGDSLVFIPVRMQALTRGLPLARARRLTTAVDHQRRVFLEIANGWASAAPADADALEAQAVALELVGDPAAVAARTRARALARDPSQRLRLGAGAVWSRLRFAIPDRPAEIAGAVALADSLLRAAPAARGEDARILAALAAVLGRPVLAAALAGRGTRDSGRYGLPNAVAEPAAMLLVYAAVGAPTDSLRALETTVEDAIRNTVSRDRQEVVRQELLAQPAVLAFPSYVFRSLPSAGPRGGTLAEAEIALQRGDTSAVLHLLRRTADVIAVLRPADLTFDALFPEAWLLQAAGDPRAAAVHLDPTLNALRFAPPVALDDAARNGAPLVRAMVLRADLAARLGDPSTAQKWARAAAILWARPESALEAVSARMRLLARAGT